MEGMEAKQQEMYAENRQLSKRQQAAIEEVCPQPPPPPPSCWVGSTCASSCRCLGAREINLHPVPAIQGC